MDTRLKKSLSAGGRETRASEDASRAAPEEKLISTQERRRMFSEEFKQNALPDTPKDPNWHFCWLSTTNTYDSIDKRMRIGYVPVKSEEYSGYEHHRVKSGEWAGIVSCNEMLLFKIPMEYFQDYMLQMHHEAPMEEAEKIRVQLENIQGARDSSGKSLGRVEGEGFGDIDRPVPQPVFQG